MYVSVIIPTYNRRNRLKQALASVYAQTYKPSEIIVVDDGSTDQTSEMIKNEYPDVLYIYQYNMGVSRARNVGILRSKHPWIAFLDSDDEWMPDKLAQQKLNLEQKPGILICHTDEIWIRNGKRVNPMKKHQKKGGKIFQHCLPLCAMSPSSIMIHRSVFDTVGLFDTSLPACEDYELWLRMTARYPVAFLNQPTIYKYGGHSDQLSQKFWGMDRFRIRALQGVIEHADLENQDKQAAIEVMLEKAQIVLNGCLKRNKSSEIAFYRELIDRYRCKAAMEK